MSGSIPTDYLYAISGALVGLLVGMTGVGGGSLMTPLLVLLFGFHPATAVGTDLLFAAGTKTVGTAMHGWRETIDWKVVRRLAIGSIPGAAITLTLLATLGAQSKATTHVITFVLGVALLLTAISIIFRPQIVKLADGRFGRPPESRIVWLTILTGFVVGIFVALTSVGAGAIGVTALVLMYPRLPTVRIVASDIAHAVPLTLVAGLGHLALGTVNLHLLGALLIGSVPGIILGSYLATRTPDLFLRPILAATLLLVGGRLIF